MADVPFGIPSEPGEQAKQLEKVLLVACEGSTNANYDYVEIRKLLMRDQAIKPLLPEFVRTCRDLGHFWGYIKQYDPKWAPRRHHVREAFTPLFNYLEGSNRTPVDGVVSEALVKFDAEGVHAVWQKALERRYADPEGAITSARTLLETVCKRVLDETSTTYTDRDDLPSLYRAVAMQLQIAPSQHTEDTFKRILGGAISVVEGLGSLRNKIGDAHGQGRRPVRPTARHAQLAVNLAGTVSTFIVETWAARSADKLGVDGGN
jgi:hypothetical protein